MPLDKLRQHLARGEYLQARREAERLIYVGDLTGVNLVLAYRGAALAHYYLQDVFGAVKLGEKALNGATESGNWELVGKIRYDLGEFYFTLGDYHLAWKYLEQCVADLERYSQVPSLQAKTYHTIGLVHRQRREYTKAVEAHLQASLLFEQEENGRHHMEAIRGVIWCHLTTGNPTLAWPYIEQVMAYLRDHPDDGLTANHFTDLAYYYRLMGDIKTSMDFCEEVLVPGRPGVDDHVHAEVYILTGENALDLSSIKEAQIFANLALDYALKAKHPFLMNRASALRRRVYEMAPSLTPE